MNAMQSYQHGAKRRNNPTAEMASTSHEERRAPTRHRTDVKEKDLTRIPTLDWQRTRAGKTVVAPLLSTVERIDPVAWIETLRHSPAQGDLFGSFDRYAQPERAKWEWYEHSGNWQNRLIHADAKRAMASLLEHEHMAGEVQCIYFDPPYGMDFDARYIDDTVQVTAFRDSYERGIHTYLDGIRETALLGRELLSDTGSFFMQIGDVNVHRCAMVLDEVFGPENRVSTIMYATGGGGSSTKKIPKAGDFILWYAKDIEAPLYFQLLYEKQDVEDWCKSSGFNTVGIDLPDGMTRKLTSEERQDPKRKLPEEARLWRGQPMLSQTASEGEQGRPFTYNGTQFGPKGLENNHWRVDQAGLAYLRDIGRLWSNTVDGTTEAGANQLHLKLYRSEVPGRRVTNHWGVISPNDKRYAVQTGDLAIQRCILMTTKPGDLVLDPTGGGGTSALVAERWGRRWISIDSSRESVAVIRERVLVHDYPAHLLIGSQEGFKEELHRRRTAGQEPLSSKPIGELDPSTGIVVDRMPFVSTATLAYAERPDKKLKREITWLVDRPAGRARGRICSRFTVETELMEIYQHPDELVRPNQARRDAGWQERIIRTLDETGVRSDSGQQWDLEGVQSVVDQDTNSKAAGVLSHVGLLVDHMTGSKRAAAIAIWPEDAKVNVTAIQRNVREVLRRASEEVLIVVGAEFAEGTEPGQSGHRWAIEIMRIKAGPELHLTGVRDKAKTSPMVLVAEPSVIVEPTQDGLFTCTVHGWNEFNPVTGVAHWHKKEDIRMWMLDTNYDGTQFCARRIHLPRRLRKKENRKVLDGLLRQEGCAEALNAAFGCTSYPFPKPKSGEIAVRVITNGGGMMSWCGAVK